MSDTGHTTHDDHEHDHPQWLAHHFDDAEQQFDAGKLGMWLFLVTEILFFSGMFCAYAMYRSLHPEIYEYASYFLNEKLGAINTGVLLFSSLTMAWAVRAAQLSQHRLLISLLGATLGCAAVFLGVKAVEYSHKWNLGLLPGKYYVTQGIGLETHSTFWLYLLCAPAAILMVLFCIWYFMSLTRSNPVQRLVSGPLLVATFCFFGGVGLGVYLESQESSHGEHAHAESHAEGEHDHGDAKHEDVEHVPTSATPAPTGAVTPVEAAAAKLVSTSSMQVPPGQAHPDQVFLDPKVAQVDSPDVNQKSMAGLFFGIYYCMTGVHAIHIIGGMLVISWLILKAARKEFHSKYFGPVDNVGLYWHLVDFIWIYLFPLLYLIK
jgi:cytochrome c oxidase subunit 3